MRLYVVRHAQSANNALRACLPPPAAFSPRRGSRSFLGPAPACSSPSMFAQDKIGSLDQLTLRHRAPSLRGVGVPRIGRLPGLEEGVVLLHRRVEGGLGEHQHPALLLHRPADPPEGGEEDHG